MKLSHLFHNLAATKIYSPGTNELSIDYLSLVFPILRRSLVSSTAVPSYFVLTNDVSITLLIEIAVDVLTIGKIKATLVDSSIDENTVEQAAISVLLLALTVSKHIITNQDHCALVAREGDRLLNDRVGQVRLSLAIEFDSIFDLLSGFNRSPF
jgi:hypothetical protein